MTVALVGVAVVALIAVIGELIAEVLFEIVGQLLFEVIVEGIRRAFGRSDRDPASTGGASVPVRERTEPSSFLRWSAAIVIGLGFGIWRGLLADTVTWGFGLAVAVALGSVIAAGMHHPIERPDNRWRRLFLWWPSDRLAWFAVANAAFVVGFLVTGI